MFWAAIVTFCCMCCCILYFRSVKALQVQRATAAPPAPVKGQSQAIKKQK